MDVFPQTKLLSGYITCVGNASTLTQDAYILYILPESISVTPLARVVGVRFGRGK